MRPTSCSIQVLLLQLHTPKNVLAAQELHRLLKENSEEPQDQVGQVSEWIWPWQGKLRPIPVITGMVWEDNGGVEDALEGVAQSMAKALSRDCPALVALLHTPGDTEASVLAFDPSGEQLGLFRIQLPAPSPLEFPTGMPDFTEEALAVIMSQPASPQMARLMAHLKEERLDAGLPASEPGRKRVPRF